MMWQNVLDVKRLSVQSFNSETETEMLNYFLYVYLLTYGRADIVALRNSHELFNEHISIHIPEDSWIFTAERSLAENINILR